MLQFDNQFVQNLPADPQTDNFCRQVPGKSYSWVTPKTSQAPKVIALNHGLAETLGMSEDFYISPQFAEVFSGNQQLPGMAPYAMRYGGHQFGNWAGQLGDGRAINLGEINYQHHHATLQLKGAGMTPYSRRADGLAVLRSSLREYLCSEAMHHLGVPTTRALSLILSGESVTRDMFYDGHPKAEPGAIVCRVASSFIRFGHFEMHSALQEYELLKQLSDFTIRRDFPELLEPQQNIDDTVYLAWYQEVTRRTAVLMAKWQALGFVHGVMNTDNMSINGVTIDYGPYGWLEDYDPNWTPNTTDAAGRRYRYGNQPAIGQWNCYCLANAIAPLITETSLLQQALDSYHTHYANAWQQELKGKLGLQCYTAASDDCLVDELQQLLQIVETDMTIFFRQLCEFPAQRDASNDAIAAWAEQNLQGAYYQPKQLNQQYQAKRLAWLQQYAQRLREDGQTSAQQSTLMAATNPRYVFRNYLAQQAIDAAENADYSELSRLYDVLSKPYDEQPKYSSYGEKRPEWARSRPGCSMLSCSS